MANQMETYQKETLELSLSRNGSIMITVYGESMKPAIRPRDRSVLSKGYGGLYGAGSSQCLLENSSLCTGSQALTKHEGLYGSVVIPVRILMRIPFDSVVGTVLSIQGDLLRSQLFLNPPGQFVMVAVGPILRLIIAVKKRLYTGKKYL